MQSFSRGWSFLKQAWGMAFKDKDLLKPSIYALIVGMIISVIGIVPIIGVAIVLGDSQFGQILTGILGLLMIFVQYMVTYLFSAMTVYLIYGYLAEGDGRMDHAWAIVRRDFFDILTLALVSTLVTWFRNATRNTRGRSNLFAGIAQGILRAFGGVLEALWTEASYLVLPAMVIDDLNLKNGLQRIWNITKQNLLLIGISFVGVRWVTGLIGFVLGFGGFLIALAIGGGAFYVVGDFNAVTILAIAVGAFIFFALVMIASVINSYTTTAYHTCLYLWAREAEKAQVAGQDFHVAAPAPLAAVLG
jgi:membrane-anchored glycerophosphoryl diester phosphodiesterase (GDPDase)